MRPFSTNWVLCYRPVAGMVRYPGMSCIFPHRLRPQNFRFGCPVFHFPITQDFAAVGDRSQNCLSIPLLFLMEYARDRYYRWIRVQHVYSFFCWHAYHKCFTLFFLYSLKWLLCRIIPREFLPLVPHELLHWIYFIRTALHELPVVIRKTQEAHQLVFCFWRFPSKYCLYRV